MEGLERGHPNLQIFTSYDFNKMNDNFNLHINPSIYQMLRTRPRQTALYVITKYANK